MKNFSLPLILQLIGVIVVIAEIILPSGGMLAVLAIGIFGYSLYTVFTTISVTAGFIFVAGDVIIIPILVIVGLKLLVRSPATLRNTLSRSKGVISQSFGLDDYIHKKGKAITNLRPSGVAMIDGKRVDVVSRGEYIEKGTDIYVAAVTGNQIIVRRDRRQIGR